jgi:ectoine hydroxylase-related dioxygenase (phytanoyl-CoA dioxygenase family)
VFDITETHTGGFRLTQRERFLFDVQGFFLVENALPRARLNEVLEAAIRLTGESPNQFVNVPMAIQHEEALLRLAAYEPMLRRIRRLVGPHPKLIDNDVAANPENASALGWHRGVEPWGFHADSEGFNCLMAKIIYYLTDVGQDDGPTRVVPGSHKQRVPFSLPDDPLADLPGTVEVHAPAGSALVFSEALLHAGSPNRSGKVRRVAIFNYGPSFVEHWQGYRPAAELVETTQGPLRQLLGGGVVYS